MLFAGLPLPAPRPRHRVRHLQSRLEGSDVASDHVRHRVHPRRRQVRRRAHIRTIAEENRPGRAEIAERVVAIGAERHTGIVGDGAGEVGRAGPVVAHRVACPQHAVARVLAEECAEEPRVSAKRPRNAEVGRPVVQVRVVGALALVVLGEERGLSGEAAWTEDVANAGAAPDVGDGRLGVAVVPRVERQLQVVAQAEVQREVRLPSPGVGDEEAVVDEPRALQAEAEEHVFVGVLVEPLLAVDREDAAGQHRITGRGLRSAARSTRPEKLAVLNRPLAGSAPSMPKFMVGTYC